MTSVAGPPLAEASAAAAPSGGYPFRGPGLLRRLAPFAVVAVLAEASLALPPRTTSTWAVVASVVLLVAVAAEFLLPWSRLPTWMTVIVPLTYCGSALALIMAAGATSGLSIVLLIPLIWTALFHRRWESACVVAAAVAVMVIVSLTPTPAPDAVTARRLLLWVSLGALISVAAHGLRDRIQLSRERTVRLQDRLRELTLIEDRDRIADDLRDKVIRRIFATGLSLQGAAAQIADTDARRRIEASVSELDLMVREVRDSVFDLNHRQQGRRLREEILGLCRELSLAPELSFSGPIDGALPASSKAQLLAVLREALGLMGQQFTPGRIGITAGEDSLLTVIDVAPLAHAAEASERVHHFLRLRERALQAGISLHIEPGPDRVRFTWRVPLGPP